MVTRFDLWQSCPATVADGLLAISACVCRPFTIRTADDLSGPRGGPHARRADNIHPVLTRASDRKIPHRIVWNTNGRIHVAKSRLGRSGDLRRTQRRGMALVTKAEIVSQTGLPTRLRIAGTYTRTDDVELLQDFVSARFAELTAATGLTDWARQVVNAVTSAASSVRSAPAPVASARPGHVFVGYDLPRLSPGIERC
jgi:hypothetical protein